MNKLIALFTVLRSGASLTDPAIWKQNQNLVNVLITLLGAVALFLPVEVSSDQIMSIAGGIAAVAGVFNVYLTTATSEKIGLPVKPKPVQAGGAEPSRGGESEEVKEVHSELDRFTNIN